MIKRLALTACAGFSCVSASPVARAQGASAPVQVQRAALAAQSESTALAAQGQSAALAAQARGLTLIAQGPRATLTPPPPVVIGSKPFGESYLLAELFAQLLESRGFRVTRRAGLGATEIAFPALQRGDIDLYPEYTGTGLAVILKMPMPGDTTTVFEVVSREFVKRYGVRWLPPLGFENTYAMSVRRGLADSLGLRTLSDLARVSGRLNAGFTADFIGLPDGWPGLQRVYGMQLARVNALAPAVKYQALAQGAVDVIDAYSTDGLLDRYPLTVLQDDRRFFPPYDAAALVRGDLEARHPGSVAILTEVSGRIDVARMRRWNARLEVAGEDVARVAGDALVELGLTAPRAGAREQGPAERATLLRYFWDHRTTIGTLTLQHLFLAGVSLLLATLVAVPLGLVLARLQARAAEGVIRGVGTLQTIPGIALLAFMLPVLGIGAQPAIVALFLYSLYPIVRNTFTGLRTVDTGAVNAAEALGMSPWQILRYVRLPLAAPVIMAGIRTAAVLNVGTATLAAFIGGGGLGEPIVSGLALSDTRMILSGAVPAAALALLVDALLGMVERYLRPRIGSSLAA